MGDSPQGHKDLDTIEATEHTHTHTHTHMECLTGIFTKDPGYHCQVPQIIDSSIYLFNLRTGRPGVLQSMGS